MENFKLNTIEEALEDFKKGKIDEEALKKEFLTINELQERLREKDVFNLGEVEYVILETSGQISIVLKPDKRNIKRSM